MNVDLRSYLFEVDPYEGFPVDDYLFDAAGFNQPDSAFELVRQCLPRRVIEVGTWKGCSAFRMAGILYQHAPDFEMVCVDTWLGSKEMWTRGERELHGRYSGLEIRHGYPRVYDQFLANVIKLGYSRQITPFPVPSTIASRVLAAIGYQADLIYLDGSHDEADVRRDLVDYWTLLSPGGHLVGDDYGWGGLAAAVEDFAQGEQIEVQHWSDEGWALRKPPNPTTGEEKTGARVLATDHPSTGEADSPQVPPTPEIVEVGHVLNKPV